MLGLMPLRSDNVTLPSKVILAFKSDYYTHIKDIPPQYGPGYDGGFEEDRQVFSKSITGTDGYYPCHLMMMFSHCTEVHPSPWQH